MNSSIEIIRDPVKGGDISIFGARYQRIIGNGGLPGSCYPGQLTRVGKIQLVDLGKRFRSVYVDKLKFLDEIYLQKDVHIRSTDISRAVSSVQHFILGLYSNRQRPWNADGIVQINILPLTSENMYPRSSACKRFAELRSHLKTTDVYTKVVEDFGPLKRKFAEALNCDADALPSIHGIYDELVARQANCLKIPKQVSPEMMKELEMFTIRYFFGRYLSSPELIRLGIGAFVSDFVTGIEDSVNGKSDRKLTVFSGHDTTVALLLMALGGFDYTWPHYGCTVVAEVHRKRKVNKMDMLECCIITSQ